MLFILSNFSNTIHVDFTSTGLSCTNTYLTEVAKLHSWLLVAFYLFLIGLLGMMYNYKNFLVTMMCVEMMYLGAVTSFVLYGIAFHDTKAAVFGLLILIFAACESAVGLGLLVATYRFGRRIDFSSYDTLGN